MMMDKVRIRHVQILAITRKELLESLERGVLFTPNVDHIVRLESDEEFRRCYDRAEWIVCDSRILYFCSKLLKRSLPETIQGSSFFTAFYEYHRDNPDCRIFLLGAGPGVAERAMERINSRMGRRIVVGAYSPSYGFEKKVDENRLIYDIINSSGANVVLVGVGSSKQEKWIMNHKDNMPGVNIWMALGATIDFEAGNIKRAPVILQKLCLEWFYRFCKEPKRLFRRYFLEDTKFFYYFLLQLISGK